MDKQELIFKVANGILNGLRTNEILEILKNHSLFQAETYYDSLDEDARKALEEKVIAADAELAANEEAAQKAAAESTAEATEETDSTEEAEEVEATPIN